MNSRNNSRNSQYDVTVDTSSSDRLGIHVGTGPTQIGAGYDFDTGTFDLTLGIAGFVVYYGNNFPSLDDPTLGVGVGAHFGVNVDNPVTGLFGLSVEGKLSIEASNSGVDITASGSTTAAFHGLDVNAETSAVSPTNRPFSSAYLSSSLRAYDEERTVFDISFGRRDTLGGLSYRSPNPADQAQGFGHLGPSVGAVSRNGGFDSSRYSANPADQESGYTSPSGDRSSGGGGSGGGGSGSGSGGGCGDGGDGGDGGGGGCGGKPVLLDLDGDGIELLEIEDSSAFYDIHGDGFRYHLSWVGPDDGILAYDRNGDGRITERGEISFVDYVEGARTDLEGLHHFDTNGDGSLTSADDEWGKFRVWRDLDGDGESDAGELRTLDAAGIQAVNLSTSGGRETREDGTEIFGRGDYELRGGVTRHLYDVSLRVAPFGYRETEDEEGVEFRWSGDERNNDGFIATTDH